MSRILQYIPGYRRMHDALERIAIIQDRTEKQSLLMDGLLDSLANLTEDVRKLQNDSGCRRASIECSLNDMRAAVERVQKSVEQADQSGQIERKAFSVNVEKALQAANEERHRILTQTAEERHHILSECFKNEIRCRWQILDALDEFLYPPSTLVRCPICSHTAEKSTYETRVAHCIFEGGRLERFVCPECGCVFGPLKMMSLNADQLADEYRQNYAFHVESDTEENEEAAFRALEPNRTGIYLNYGAGAWNHTTEKLRAEGFEVYDYEPYASVDGRPWVLRTMEEVRQRRYDGIFSNDLIEHLRRPSADLMEMHNLLNPGGRMVHCSGCYEYAFEYTRFHLYFLTGSSLSRLSESIGMTASLGERLYSKSSARLCTFTLL